MAKETFFCEGWRLALIAINFLSLLSLGQAARCWECDRTNVTEAVLCDKTLEQIYAPEVPVNETFCKSIRESESTVAALCKRHPNGYQLYCELDRVDNTRTCRHQCPAKTVSSAQLGNGACAQQASDFRRFIMASAVVVLARVWRSQVVR